jgi:hypothetical protein
MFMLQLLTVEDPLSNMQATSTVRPYNYNYRLQGIDHTQIQLLSFDQQFVETASWLARAYYLCQKLYQQ